MHNGVKILREIGREWKRRENSSLLWFLIGQLVRLQFSSLVPARMWHGGLSLLVCDTQSCVCWYVTCRVESVWMWQAELSLLECDTEGWVCSSVTRRVDSARMWQAEIDYARMRDAEIDYARMRHAEIESKRAESIQGCGVRFCLSGTQMPRTNTLSSIHAQCANSWLGCLLKNNSFSILISLSDATSNIVLFQF